MTPVGTTQGLKRRIFFCEGISQTWRSPAAGAREVVAWKSIQVCWISFASSYQCRFHTFHCYQCRSRNYFMKLLCFFSNKHWDFIRLFVTIYTLGSPNNIRFKQPRISNTSWVTSTEMFCGPSPERWVVSRLTFREIGLPEGELVILLKARAVSGLKDEDLHNLLRSPDGLGWHVFLF